MPSPDNDKMLTALQKSLHKQRVLIVDRHPAARESLRLMLAELGIISVHGVGSAAEVLRQVRSHRFDLILSDYYLEDGRDAQQLLEEMRLTHLIPRSTLYLVVTSERSYSNVVALAELAPDGYLLRPFTPDQLHARLVRAAYRKHQLRHILRHLEHGNPEGAIDACDQLAEQDSDFAYDALRYKGELLLQIGRAEEAEGVFRHVIAVREQPWARMGLARALRDQGQADHATSIASELLRDAPDFLAVNDFLASTLAQLGRLDTAQQILQHAAERSPYNTQRQRQVGDLASRNGDLLAAEKAYGMVIERSRGSTLRHLDDFVNLSRVLIDRGDVGAARRVIANMQREWRNDKQADMAALIGESLCLHAEGRGDRAAPLIEQALTRQAELDRDSQHVLTARPQSPRLAVDLARACYASGLDREADALVRRVASSNNEDEHLMSQIRQIFEQTGHGDSGRDLLAQVDKEMVVLNNRGIIAARSGNLRGAVELLMQAADEAPNLQFLLNAAKAIYSLLDQDGWDAALAARADDYLQRAELKDPDSPKVNAARLLRSAAARKHGIDPRRAG